MTDEYKNRTYLITGSTDGIGKQTALEIAMKGGRVLIHGRNEDRLKAAAQEITSKSGNKNISTCRADLSDMCDVARFADQILQSEKKLDVLINNAGVFMNDYKLTVDGFETTIAVNHFAPFLLTNRLLPLLKQSSDARVITLSSVAHLRGKMYFDNIHLTGNFSGYRAYAQSKLANVLFAYEFSKRYSKDGVKSNAVHPGVITTKLLREGFGMGGDSLQVGAATSVRLALDPTLRHETGQYYEDTQRSESSPATHDQADWLKLWNLTEKALDKF